MALDEKQRAALRDEFHSDPTSRGYSGKSAPEIWDLLCLGVETREPSTFSHRPVAKRLLADTPGWIDVEAAWRKADSPLAVMLRYFDEVSAWDWQSPLGQEAARALAALGLTADMRGTLEAACEVEVAGKVTHAEPRRIAVLGAPLGSVEDVAAVLKEIG